MASIHHLGRIPRLLSKHILTNYSSVNIVGQRCSRQCVCRFHSVGMSITPHNTDVPVRNALLSTQIFGYDHDVRRGTEITTPWTSSYHSSASGGLGTVPGDSDKHFQRRQPQTRADKVSKKVLDQLRMDVLKNSGTHMQYSLITPLHSYLYFGEKHASSESHSCIISNLANLVERRKSAEIGAEIVDVINHVTANVHDYPLHKLLLLCDIIFMVRERSELTDFYYYLLNHLEMELPSLSAADIVQMMLYISAIRNAPSPLLAHIETCLETCVGELNGHEIGLVCNGFFLANHSIRSVSLLKQINRNMLRHISKTPVYLIGNVCRALRHANYIEDNLLEEIAKATCEELARSRQPFQHPNNVASYMQIAMSFATARYAHEDLFNQLMAKMQQLLEKTNSLRFKDLVSFAHACLVLNYPVAEDFLEAMVAMMRADSKMMYQFHEVWILAVLVLVHNNKFPDDILKWTLSERYIKFKTGRLLEQHFQIVFIDSVVSLLCPNYKGPHLSKDNEIWRKQRAHREEQLGMQMHGHYGHACLALEPLLGGPEFIKCHHVKTFCESPGIEIRVGDDGAQLPFNENSSTDTDKVVLAQLRSQNIAYGNPSDRNSIISRLLPSGSLVPSGSQKSAVTYLSRAGPARWSGQERLVIKMCSQTHYLRNQPDLHGYHQHEAWLLTQLGYHVLLVSPAFCDTLCKMTAEEQSQTWQKILTPLFSIKFNTWSSFVKNMGSLVQSKSSS